MAARQSKSRIPGVAEVPMPPASSPMGKALKGVTDALTALVTPDPASEPTKAKAARRPRGSAPKPVRMEPNFGKSGIRIFVGESKIPVATISQETLDEAFNDYGFAPTRLSELESLLKLAETQRAEAQGELEVAGRDVAFQREKRLIAESEYDKLEKTVAEITLERDAAEADRNVWEKAAKEDRAQLVTLADELNRQRQKVRDIEKLRGEALVERDATILGWRLATVAAVFGAIAIAIWKGGGL